MIHRSNDCTTQTPVTEGMKAIIEADESLAKATTGPFVNPDTTVDDTTVKVLGSIWDTSTDQFTFVLSDLSEKAKLLPATKRSLLKVLVKIFDPLGLLSPFTIQWKVLFQEICSELTGMCN